MMDSTVTDSVVLRTEDLSLAYGNVRAVDKLNLTVRGGEIYGFLGRNGAGKTSTIRMLMGMIRPKSGRIHLLGRQSRRIAVRQKKQIGYVSQEQFFYPWMTCRGLGRFVSGFYPTWDHQEFTRLLGAMDLPGSRRIAHLSGGMKVKLALSLALAHRPPILILDEPTSGLDPVARREFLEIISEQARAHQRTTFFSSHLIDEVERVADRVGIIHRGKLEFEGDVPTLQESVRQVRLPATAQPTNGEAANPEQTSSADQPPTEQPPKVADEQEPAAGSASRAQVGPVQLRPAAVDRHAFLARVKSHGFRVLRSGIGEASSVVLYAAADAWHDPPFSAESVTTLSLEDIFIAMASETTSLL